MNGHTNPHLPSAPKFYPRRHRKLTVRSLVDRLVTPDCTIGRFPPKLRSMCHCLYQVVTQRFQQSTPEAVWIVIGTVIFLRFINPAIGTCLLTPVLLVHLSWTLPVWSFSITCNDLSIDSLCFVTPVLLLLPELFSDTTLTHKTT